MALTLTTIEASLAASLCKRSGTSQAVAMRASYPMARSRRPSSPASRSATFTGRWHEGDKVDAYPDNVASSRSTPVVEVACADCGAGFELSVRNEYEHRSRGLPHRCRRCRHPKRAPSPAVLARMRAWWLARFTLDE